MEHIIQAESISRHFDRRLVVNNISLSVTRGEALALLGTNGAGKTTTLRLLTGELAPHKGTVKINEIDINLFPCKSKRHLGYLPDTPPLYSDLTVDEFLNYCAQIRGLKKNPARKRIRKIKQFCELESVSNRLIKKLSKGFQQRVGIAQAVLHQPVAIILDEPTNGLDPNQVIEMRDMIRQLKNDAAVLLSTHQLSEVEQVCERVLMLKEGNSIFCKPISELQQTTKIRMRFTSPPPIKDIEKYDEVKSVESINAETIDIHATGNLDILKNSLLAQSQLQSWNLVEIYDLRDKLENVFMQQIFHSE